MQAEEAQREVMVWREPRKKNEKERGDMQGCKKTTGEETTM